MKARVLFGVGGFLFVLLALYVFPYQVFELLLLPLCALAAYELTGSTGLVKDKNVAVGCAIFATALAFNQTRFMIDKPLHGWFGLVMVTGLVIALLAALLRRHQSMQIQEVACGLFGGLIVPYLLLSLTRIFQMEHGQYLVLIPLLAAWGSDTCALFAGMAFGRHKLAPIVSPKKTVEGAVGGVAGGILFLLVFAAAANHTIGLGLPYGAAALIGAMGSVIGQLGDLSFSIIKRQTGIKDYGSLFPGHGGVLDRFDSVLFVAPVVEAVLLLF